MIILKGIYINFYAQTDHKREIKAQAKRKIRSFKAVIGQWMAVNGSELLDHNRLTAVNLLFGTQAGQRPLRSEHGVKSQLSIAIKIEFKTSKMNRIENFGASNGKSTL